MGTFTFFAVITSKLLIAAPKHLLNPSHPDLGRREKINLNLSSDFLVVPQIVLGRL